MPKFVYGLDPNFVTEVVRLHFANREYDLSTQFLKDLNSPQNEKYTTLRETKRKELDALLEYRADIERSCIAWISDNRAIQTLTVGEHDGRNTDGKKPLFSNNNAGEQLRDSSHAE